jgi:hypothetical protein
MHRLRLYNDSIASSGTQNQRIYSKDDVTMLYLQQLVTTMPTNHNLYREVQTMYSKYEFDMETFDQLDIHVSHIQRKLHRLELTYESHIEEDRHSISNQSNHHLRQHRLPTRSSTKHKYQAHSALQSQKFRTMKCWGCGHSHHLRDCPTTSNEQRQRLWEEHRTKSAKNNNKPMQT